MKAVILAGGRGTRIDTLSVSRNKCMVPVKGRPVIEYSLDCATNTDVEEIVVVVGHRAEEIMNTYGNRYNDQRIKYVIQWEQKGLVNAIECAREVIAGDDFLLLLGDEILLNPRHQAMIDAYRESDCIAICGILWVDDKELVKRTYTLIKDESNITITQVKLFKIRNCK